MIKFLSHTKDGNTLVGLGLSEENIRRLKANDPIYFSLEPLGIEGIEVTILYGETEDAIKAQLTRSPDQTEGGGDDAHFS